MSSLAIQDGGVVVAKLSRMVQDDDLSTIIVTFAFFRVHFLIKELNFVTFFFQIAHHNIKVTSLLFRVQKIDILAF